MYRFALKIMGLKKGKGANVTESIVLPESLDDNHLRYSAAHTTYAICGLITIFVLWFSVAEIKELVIAQGQIEPSGLIKNIHHLEGGQVGKVHVREGDLVDTGAVLVTLSSVGSKQDLKQLEARRVFLSLNRIRLESLLQNKKPDFSKWSNSHPNLVKEQLDQYRTILRRTSKAELILSSKAKQYGSELQAALLEHKSESTRVRLLAKRLKIRQQLLQKKYSTLREVIEAKAELQLAKSRAILSQGKADKTRQLLKQAKLKLDQSREENRSKLFEKYSQVSRELFELGETIAKFSDRVNRLKIISPYHGIVQKISVKSGGEVIAPGGLVANIVALEDEMIAEVRFNPKDRAQFDVGDKAEINITAFDKGIFGVLSGEITNISASILRDEKGVPYYKAHIELDNNYFQKDGRQHFILPGMQVRAEIITGSRSLMKYLLKPVYRSLDQAFSEQ